MVKLPVSKLINTMARFMNTGTTGTTIKNLNSHILVIGGNGFVGSNICQKAIHKGIKVSSLNRSGKPEAVDEPWIDQVNWIKGDVFDKEKTIQSMKEVDGVISTVGAFGSSEYMEEMCGDATIEATKSAKAAGIKRFVFISEAQVGDDDIPRWFPLFSYFNGKKRAELAVKARFPRGGVNLRPGFVYGWRRVGEYSVPLQLIGLPVSKIGRDLGIISDVIQKIPLIGTEIASAVSVGELAKAAILCATSDGHSKSMDTKNIIRLSESFYNL